MKILFFALSLLVASSSFASLLEKDAGTQTIENVNVAKGAHVKIDNQNVYLTTIGAGLRSKKVLVANVKVYVAEIMVSEPQNFVKKADSALNSMDQITDASIDLTFVRTVDAGTVQVAFRDSFTANNVSLDDPSIKAFLANVNQGGDAAQGKTMTILVSKANGQETLTYEDPNGKQTTVVGKPGLMKQVFSIWLGNSADSGLADLKNQLLN